MRGDLAFISKCMEAGLDMEVDADLLPIQVPELAGAHLTAPGDSIQHQELVPPASPAGRQPTLDQARLQGIVNNLRGFQARTQSACPSHLKALLCSSHTLA